MFSLISVYFACWAAYARSWYEWLTTPDDVDEINDIFDWFYAIEDPPAPPAPSAEMVLILKPGEDTPTSFAPRNQIPADAVVCASYVAIVCRDRQDGPVNVFMLRHGVDSKWAGSLDLPGGAVAEEDGTGYEAMEKAAFRECKEECGIVVDGSMFTWRRLLLRPKKHGTVAFNAVFVMFVLKNRMFSPPKKERLESKFDYACWMNIGTAIKIAESGLQNPRIRAKNDIPHILRAILHSL
jgi:8-oxo-dGTP pyrophosphatase MutT (NUDIX family)